MTPAEYERLVGKFVKETSSSFADMAAAVSGFGSSNKVPGASGYKHQIDVSLTVASWLVLVECKRWHKRVGVQEVLVLASRVADIRPTVPERQIWAALVTIKGGSANALALARHFGISIDCVHSPEEYSLRLRSQVKVGVGDAMPLADRVVAEVVRASKGDG